MPVFKLKKISAEDGRDIYDLLQTTPKDENGLINKANGLSYQEFKSWLAAKQKESEQTGIVSGLAFGIFLIKKNMSNRQLILCEIVYFLILNAILCFIGLNIGWFNKELKSMAIMEVMFILIYIIVTVLVLMRLEKSMKS